MQARLLRVGRVKTAPHGDVAAQKGRQESRMRRPRQNLFDRSPQKIYLCSVQKGSATTATLPPGHFAARLYRGYFSLVGRKLFRLIETISTKITQSYELWSQE